MKQLNITNGQVLLPQGPSQTNLTLSNTRIVSIGRTSTAGPTLDATGLLVLPGIIDIHGDAFERQLQPRPGVDFPPGIALADTESQLLANGITTAFHGVTLSWEPGLRGIETFRALLAALTSRQWACDMRIHLRWEAYNLAALDEAITAIITNNVHLLAFNDHTPSILRHLADPAKAIKFSERASLSPTEFRTVAESVAAHEPRARADAHARLAHAARSAGLPIASHDDDTVATRDQFRELGARICEFPMAEDVARAARQVGDAIVMGSPNVVRGRSHLGWASAARMAEDRICTILSSDYYYPAMRHAALILAGRGKLTLSESWSLISANPAKAAHLTDRGAISPDLRADLVLLDPIANEIAATITQGRPAYLSQAGAARLKA